MLKKLQEATGSLFGRKTKASPFVHWVSTSLGHSEWTSRHTASPHSGTKVPNEEITKEVKAANAGLGDEGENIVLSGRKFWTAALRRPSTELSQ